MADFDIPAGAQNAIQSVKDAASALPAVNILGKQNYASFRPNFGGKIDSWIANYASRLILLQGLLADIESGFELPAALHKNEALTSGLDMNQSEIKELILAVYAQAADARAAVETLLGQGGEQIEAAITVFERFSGTLDTLYGMLNTIQARYDREVDMAGKDEARLEKLLECKFAIPKWCKPVPKLVGISGGLPEVGQDLNEVSKEFQEVRTKMLDRYQRIIRFAETALGKPIDLYRALEARELELLSKLKSDVPARAHLQARRIVLHRVGRAIQNCSEPTKQRFATLVAETGVFENVAHLNTFIFNQKGAIYRSPFDRARNQQYRLRAEVLLKTDWLGIAEKLSRELMSSADKETREDALRLERTVMQLQLSGIPAMEYPSALARPDIEVEIPFGMNMQLAKGMVSSDVLQRAFNLYSSKLSGMSFKLLRTGFTLKMRFGVGEDTQLLYAPKDREWNIPRQYLATDTGIGIAARLVTKSKPLDMLEEVAVGAPEVLGEFMRQCPHDWYYDPELAGTGVEGRVVEKGKVGKARKLRGYRLVGAPSFKSVLDKSLVELSDIGRAMLIIEVPYTQGLADDFTAVAKPGLPRITLSLPVKERITATEKDEAMLFDRFAAIDLGERGIGYAVFDAKTMEKIESGYRAIPDITNLIRRTWRYENRPNQRQKFQAKYNVNLSELRENVVGNVCHQINRICAYYNAFPVMEYMVTDRLNNQVKSVYEAVVNRYVWSSTEAHKTARVQFWLGGEGWQHPYLKSVKDKKPLIMSPGRGVSGKGTSQRCSCCGRNPFELLSAMKDSDKIAVLDGKAKLNGAELVLFERSRESGDEAQKRRRENKRPSIAQQLTPGNYRVDELRQILRHNLRRAPQDRRSKDTTVSRYHCVFADCGKSMHADQNAAINIGEKFKMEIAQ